MSETAACCDLRDAHLRATAKQLPSSPLEPYISQECAGGAPEKTTEMLLQCARGNFARRGQIAQTPRALGLGFELLNRPFEAPWKRLTDHGAAPRVAYYTELGAKWIVRTQTG